MMVFSYFHYLLILLYFRANHNIVHRKPLERNKMDFIFILFRNIILYYTIS